MSTPSVSPPVLPPELITAIIYEVDDVESLKLCSLVASSLRSRCQRILYSTLTIRMDNCAALCKLLAESSHIADYVTNLVIRTLYPTMREPDLENFRQILVKVRNVRRCTLDGQWNRFPMHVPIGHPVVPPVDIPPLVLDFLVRQPLRYLSLSCVRIPTSMLGRFLTTVPELSFSSDSVAVQDGVPPTAVQTPVLHSLFLSSTVKDVGPYVVQPQNMRCLCALRHLSFQTPGNGWAAELIQAASRTLQHLHFSCREHPPLNLPASDGFRTTTARPAVISQTTNVLSSLVFPETLPALAEVQIEQFFADNGIFDPTPYISLIALLEASLASYSTPPRIRWFLVMYDQDAQYTDFVDAVRRGMPKADSEGRLIMEACAIVASRGKLNKRFRI
ncbi:hypothetical protein MSAN_01928200 [Mycena sanguinolenta]|uniref:F-box domain-containing protein n=1 Tax=Mycena sanguinolenta TaxID=230812 RepID=A0A8H6XQ68_9AGAR|nr:hypothetical protein MSAN_01928200 [Mycena sanguinolenta]